MEPDRDPSPAIWEGRRISVAGQATGGRLPAARYRATADRLSWTTGRLGRRTESVPIWAIRDAVVSQNVQQRARRLGDITVSLQHPDYDGLPTFVVLKDVDHPKDVVRRLTDAARAARSARESPGE
ncbi:MAG TPA: PH domain-containing protein [Nocardioides sp.]|nr:PH domain-containing protein [Nocardioides sp.]